MKQSDIRKASVRKLVSGTLQSTRIPVSLGSDEVGLLMASNIQVDQQTAGSNYVKSWIYKKSEKVPTKTDWINTGWLSDDSVMDYSLYRQVQATAVGFGITSSRDYKVYPEPLIFIRPPSLLTYGGAAYLELFLWFKTVKMTKEQIAKLMVKDHA